MMKTFKKGFTLAEVLTTLMVIGVVAAMTIPTLMNSTEDQQRKVALKKAVSVLGQAVQLNKAKEEECTISDAASLANCIAKSLAGSIKGDVITTADGMSYKFYVADNNVKYSLEEKCGAGFGTSAAAWHGADACGVIVDINGAGKGVSFTDTDDDDESILPDFSDAGFSAEPGQKDLYTLTLTDTGVRPTCFSASSRGYGFMYGVPDKLEDVYADTCRCEITVEDGEGNTTTKIEYKPKVTGSDGQTKCPDATADMTCELQS